MRYTSATLVLTALLAAACAEPAADSNDMMADDTVAVDATDPASDVAPSPIGTGDRTGGSDTVDDRADQTTDDTTDDVADDAAEEPADEPDVASIPARFQGEWNAELDACGTGESPTRLRISADRIRFYESAGVVQAVAIESERVVNVTAEFTGEGQTWVDERRLTLSDDGSRLTVSGGGDLVRHRCPA